MEMAEKIHADRINVNKNFQGLTSVTIMMVDDEPITMEVVRAFLEEVGYHNFILVEKSYQAMDVLEKNCPDILLLDLNMPEVSGYDILSAARAHPKFEHLPIIILTSSSDTESKLRALDLGATDFLAKPVDPSELKLRMRNNLVAKAYQNQLAYYDPLTSLPNKQLFMERFELALEEAKRYQEVLALLNIALDKFDRINASIGPHGGDEVLRQIAHRIESMIRSVDLLGHATGDKCAKMNLFRADGSTFSLLLDRIDSAENTALVAKRIIDTIRKPIHAEDKEIYTTASVGIAMYPADSKDSAVLMKLASGARDYVKTRGGDSFQFSSSSINVMYEKRLNLETRLRRALERDEFVLFYQPKVAIESGQIKGVESLIRWTTDDGDLIQPNDFIPLAEDIGLITPIGEWTLNEACSQLMKWHRAGSIPVSVSINLSAKQFQDRELSATIKRIIDRSGVDPHFITLELTESLLIDDIENTINILKRLKDMGLKLSIDDFGTGYSSFNYLRKIPVDELKIDQTFMDDLSDNPDSRSIVSSMIYLSHSLGMLAVAEGVETQEQLNFLQKERCDEYQGFLFSRPVPNTELIELLFAHNKDVCGQLK